MDSEKREPDVYGTQITEAETVDARRSGEAVEERIELTTKPLTLWADTWRRLKRNRLALVGLGIIVVFIVVGALETIFYEAHWYVRESSDMKAAVQATQAYNEKAAAYNAQARAYNATLEPGQPQRKEHPLKSTPPGYLAPYDPDQVNYSLSPKGVGAPPSWAHPFGTDYLGRDVLSRTLVATRIAMLVGVIAVAIALTIGLIAGPISGYYGGWVDSVVMRVADVFFAFPYILFVLLILSVLGAGFQNVFIAIGVLGWATFARIARGQILTVKTMEYVEAARAQGASDLRIIFRHVLPNSMAPVYVAIAMAVGGAIATEAALSYLGIGVQAPNSSWGLMISEAVNYLPGGNWWFLLFPSVALVTTVFGFISFGNGLRDATDPKLKE